MVHKTSMVDSKKSIFLFIKMFNQQLRRSRFRQKTVRMQEGGPNNNDSLSIFLQVSIREIVIALNQSIKKEGLKRIASSTQLHIHNKFYFLEHKFIENYSKISKKVFDLIN